MHYSLFLVALLAMLPLTLGAQGQTRPAASAPAASQPQTKPSHDWEPAMKAFEAVDKDSPPPKGTIVFTGASNITRWKSLEADFPRHKVIHRGFGGSGMGDMVLYADRVVIPYAPRLVVFQAGGNDVRRGRSVEDIVGDFKAFTAKVRKALPQTRIAYLSIPSSPSVWKNPETFRRVNDEIGKFIKTQDNMRYIDCWNPALDESGKPRPELFEKDGLHNNAEGYKLYVKIIEPYLDEK